MAVTDHLKIQKLTLASCFMKQHKFIGIASVCTLSIIIFLR